MTEPPQNVMIVEFAGIYAINTKSQGHARRKFLSFPCLWSGRQFEIIAGSTAVSISCLFNLL